MRLYKLFSYNVEIQYKSCLCSKAVAFTVLTTIFTISFPMIVAYQSRGFWLKRYSFYEQPEVKFKYQFIFMGETADLEKYVSCGNGQVFEYLLKNDENCVSFKVKEINNDNIYKTDEIYVDLMINIPKNQSIISTLLILIIEVELDSICPLLMESMIVIDRQYTPQVVSTYLHGDLEVHQVKPLPCPHHYKDVRFNTSLFEKSLDDPNEFWIDKVIANYFSRDVTTNLVNMYERNRRGLSNTFSMSVHIRIPEQFLYYKPSFWQEIKWAWPQYLSLLLIFHWIMSKIRKYVFYNRLFMAWEVVPWKSVN